MQSVQSGRQHALYLHMRCADGGKDADLGSAHAFARRQHSGAGLDVRPQRAHPLPGRHILRSQVRLCTRAVATCMSGARTDVQQIRLFKLHVKWNPFALFDHERCPSLTLHW